MLWWFVAAVGGWLATGAFIPVLWKLSKLVSDEEPTGTEVTGGGAVPPCGASGFNRGYSRHRID